jgi:hypothetical protein
LILFLVATIDLGLRLAGIDPATGPLEIWMIACLPLAALTAGGYLLSILASSRLRQQ